MRIENGNVIIEYTDMLIVMSTYVRRFKFVRENHMPKKLIIETPPNAWDLSNGDRCECIVIPVEGEPPEKWFNQAVKHDLQKAPEPVNKPEPLPQKPVHKDEMIVVKSKSGNEVRMNETIVDDEVVETANTDKNDIEYEDDYDEDEDENFTDGIETYKENDEDGQESIATIPDGFKRTSEHDRALRAISQSESDESESDRDE